MTLQQVTEAPGWVNWLIIGAGWAASILHPIAILVTVLWGGLQIYGWFEKRRRKGLRRRRDDL